MIRTGGFTAESAEREEGDESGRPGRREASRQEASRHLAAERGGELAADEEVDGVGAELVGELALVGVAEEEEVGALAGGDLASVLEAEEFGGVEGGGGDCLGGAEVAVADGEGDGHGDGGAGGGAGVVVGGEGEEAAGLDESSRPGVAAVEMEAAGGEDDAEGARG